MGMDITVAADALVDEWVLDGMCAVVTERQSAARKWEACSRALELARREPWVMNGADSRLTGRAAIQWSETAMVAELATTFTVSEGTIRQWANHGSTLRERLPLVWQQFAEGRVPEQNAAEAARLTAELPEGVWVRFDEELTDLIGSLTPAKFRVKARGIRERIHPTTAEVRHQSAREQRRVWFEPDRDGMGWFGAYLPADVGHTVMTGLDQTAFGLSQDADETRTMDQLRADVLIDTLTGAGGGVQTTVSLAVTVPMLTLLGGDGGPAVLDGVGPIPLEMAKQLAGHATSLVRILTDPVTGTVLNMEGRTRRIPNAMKRWLRHRDRVCTFPGCTRRASHSDLDHTTDVQHGGLTANGNLAHLCRKHHRLKHQTNWRYTQQPTAGPALKATWTSPRGHTIGNDPPPF